MNCPLAAQPKRKEYWSINWCIIIYWLDCEIDFYDNDENEWILENKNECSFENEYELLKCR